MSKKDKLIERFVSIPKDFTYDELRSLLKCLGYTEDMGGKTSGSGVAFFNPSNRHIIRLHKPHPRNTLPLYAVKNIVENLKRNGELS